MSAEGPQIRDALPVYVSENPDTEHVSPGYKQTEVGMIPEDWEVKHLGECLANPPEYGINAPAVSYVEGLPAYIRITDITDDGHFAPERPASVDREEASRYFLREGDLVFARTGASVGKSYLYDKEDGTLVFAGFLIRIRPNKNQLHPGFLANYIMSSRYWTWVSTMSMRSGQPGINGKEYAELPVPLPPPSEQRAIKTALSDVDSLLSVLDKLIAKKRNLKTAAMQRLLTGEQRLPEFRGEWEKKRLGNIATLTIGRTPSRAVQDYWGRGYPWLSIADLQTKYPTNTKEEITEAAARNMNVISKGTLVMSFKLTIGKLAFTGSDMYSNEAICAFNDLDADAEFVYYILGRTDFSLYGKQAVKGYTLNRESLDAVEIPYPSLEEQSAIASVLSDMDAEIEALEARRDKTCHLKQGIMQELLTGRTRLV